VLGRLGGAGRLVRGDFRLFEPRRGGGVGAEQWCDADVLRILRRRSLAALRAKSSPSAPPPTGASCRPGITSATRVYGRIGLRRARRARLGHRSAGRRSMPAWRSSRWCWLHGSATTHGDARRVAPRLERSPGRAPVPSRVVTAGFALQPGRYRAVDLAPRRDRFHRHAPGDPGRTVRRRRVLLPPARTGRDRETALKAALWELIWAGWVTATRSHRCAHCWAAPVLGNGQRPRTGAPPARLSDTASRTHSPAAPNRRWPAGGRPAASRTGFHSAGPLPS